jgi:hypothetical protein
MADVINLTPRHEQLALQITDLMLGEDFATRWSALAQAMTFQMSLLCPDCRTRLATELTLHGAPTMLDAANKSAAESGEPETWEHLEH